MLTSHLTHFEYSVDHTTKLRNLVLCKETGKSEADCETTLSDERRHSGRFDEHISFEYWIADVPESMNEGIRRNDLRHVFSVRHCV